MRGKSFATRQAKNLLAQMGFNVHKIDIAKKDLSIDVNRIAEKLNINVLLRSFSDDISGVFFKKNNELYLGVNEKQNTYRQRFTIAHEIGHYKLHVNEILHYDKDFFLRSKDIYSPEEREANHFAGELLMPEDLINKCIDNGIRSISVLAKRLNVSEDAMRYRLTILDLL